MPKKMPKAANLRKTIQILDAALVARLQKAIAKRQLPMLSVTQVAKIALGEWLKAQGE